MTLSSADMLVSKLQKVGLFIGAAGAFVCLAGFLKDRQAFAVAYLIAFIYWSGILLGSLSVIMVHNLTGGHWGYPLRGLLGILAKLMPWLILFFLPLVYTLKDLYPWMDPQIMAQDPLLKEKAFYLNISFFTFRAIFYFFIWTCLAWLATRDYRVHKRPSWMSLASGLGLVAYTLSITFSSLDWVMSLEPHWNSTISGLIFAIGQALSGFAFVILLALLLVRKGPLCRVLTPERCQDLGTLVMVFIMLWAYVSISQFIILWQGNIPETGVWYVKRLKGGWEAVGLALVLLHFAVPFFLLLMRSIKKSFKAMTAVVSLVLIMRWIDIFWQVKPALSESFRLSGLDLAAVITLGGFFMALIAYQIKRTPLVLEDDPVLQSPAASQETTL